jgi:hypothetical protein
VRYHADKYRPSLHHKPDDIRKHSASLIILYTNTLNQDAIVSISTQSKVA